MTLDHNAAIRIHFSDYFEVNARLLEEYGAFNVSLIGDLPLFIDPFLLFNSPNPDYRMLHDNIIRYVAFLRDKSRNGEIKPGLLKAWFMFGEVKQNWLGYSIRGNRGTGLGKDFANALYQNLGTIFANFGQESITRGSHLEKLCLISSGVGRDNVSDFTTNLIKQYLLEYTQRFATQHIKPSLVRPFVIEKVAFSYETETWRRAVYTLPSFNGEYVLLTPMDMLTKDDMWINKHDLINNYELIANAVPNDQLRAQVNNYLLMMLPHDASVRQYTEVVTRALQLFPEVIEHYIREKEDNGDKAKAVSAEKVEGVQRMYVARLAASAQDLAVRTSFYSVVGDTFEEARQRVSYLKHWIEDLDGYRLFYDGSKSLTREHDVHLLFTLLWFGSSSDVNREVNNGRGPVDFKISRGNSDKTLIEFKLASNTQLRRNLVNQVAVYEQANDTKKSLKVILYFTAEELRRTHDLLKDLNLANDPSIILIDARADNKPSASKA